jgi:hypothetical protein
LSLQIGRSSLKLAAQRAFEQVTRFVCLSGPVYNLFEVPKVAITGKLPDADFFAIYETR